MRGRWHPASKEIRGGLSQPLETCRYVRTVQRIELACVSNFASNMKENTVPKERRSHLSSFMSVSICVHTVALTSRKFAQHGVESMVAFEHEMFFFLDHFWNS